MNRTFTSFTPQDIARYYNANTIFYRVFWHESKSLGIHFGYYDPDIKNHQEAILRVNETLSKLADIKPSDKVLDAGCGVGGSAIWIAKNIGANVTGITISSAQAKKANKYKDREGVGDKTSFEIMDFNKTSFPNESFDVVWGIESFCYALDKEILLKEIFRILKPGGRIVMSDWFALKTEFNSEEKKLYDEFINGFAVPSLETPKSMKEVLEKVGFEKVYQEDHGKALKKNFEFGLRRTKRLTIPAKVLPKIIPKLKDVTSNYYGILAANEAYKKDFWTLQAVVASKPK